MNFLPQIGKDARDLITKLLHKSPSQRLGSRNDAEDLKKHRFFKQLDWKKLKLKMYKAPIIPDLKGGDDVSQFAADFTDKDPSDKPAEPPTAPNAHRFFRSKFD